MRTFKFCTSCQHVNTNFISNLTTDDSTKSEMHYIHYITLQVTPPVSTQVSLSAPGWMMTAPGCRPGPCESGGSGATSVLSVLRERWERWRTPIRMLLCSYNNRKRERLHPVSAGGRGCFPQCLQTNGGLVCVCVCVCVCWVGSGGAIVSFSSVFVYDVNIW